MGRDVSGRSTGEEGRYSIRGASYDPEADRWKRIAPSPVRSNGSARAVWTGRSMIVWSGEEGAEYHPAVDRWREIPRAPLDPRIGQSAVWSGGEMVIWGGNTCGTCFRRDGAAYDPARRRWRVIPSAPIPGRDRHAATAIAGGMFVWGGCCREDGYLDDGALYRHASAKAPRAARPASFRSLPRGWRELRGATVAIGRRGAVSETLATSWPYRWSERGPAADLPPGGIIVSALLLRRAVGGRASAALCRGVPPQADYPRLRRFPLQIPAAPAGTLEGDENVAEYRIFGAVRNDYHLEVRVDINEPLPHPGFRGRAQRVLNGLQLPNWPNVC